MSVRVMVVDDNEVNRVVASKLLSKLGVDVVAVEDGYAAIEESQKSELGLILLDIRMPGIDGYEVARRLRADGCQVPIVALTAEVTSSERQRCEEAGMDDFYPKPIMLDTLKVLLARWNVVSDQ